MYSASSVSENVQLVRSDYTATDVTTKSKSFVYTWKISNFRLLYDQEETCIASYESDFSGDNENPQLWRVKLHLNRLLTLFFYDTQPFKIDVEFDTKAAEVDYDSFALHAYIVTRSTGDHEIYQSGNARKVTGNVLCSISSADTSNSKLFNEANGFLPDGNLTLKFKLVFTKNNVVCSSANSVSSLLRASRQRSAEFENMLDNEMFSDARIVAGGREIRVHKVFLASRSPVFAAMFQHDMRESKENVIEITDVEHEIVLEMLRYVYTGEVKRIEDVAADLLVAADKYDLERLKLMCEDALINDLRVENAIAMLIHGEKYGAKRLKEHALNFFKIHAKEIVRTESFEYEFDSVMHLLPNVFKSLVLSQ